MGNRNEQLAARRAYEVEGYELSIDRPELGLQIYTKPLAGEQTIGKCFLGKAGKPAWFYRFRNPAEFAAQVERQIKSCQASADYKAKRKAEAAAPAAVEVGDVFQSTWGYDQTNVDYFQVTRVISAKTIEIRKIGAVS